MAGKERKLVTDEDVERYVWGPKRLRKKRGGSGRGAIMELFALCCPPDDPFIDPVEKGKEAVRDWKDEHPPSPVRVLMKDGVWLVPQEPPPASRSVTRQRRLIEAGRCRVCGRPRGEDGSKTMCRRCADKVSRRAKAARSQWTEEQRAKFIGQVDARKKRLRQDGRCVACGGARAPGLKARCRTCADKNRDKSRRQRRARRVGEDARLSMAAE